MGLVLRLRWQMTPWARPLQSWLHTVRAPEGLLPTNRSWLCLHFGGRSSSAANLDGDFFEVPLALIEGEVDVPHRPDGVMGVSKMKGVTNFTGSALERGVVVSERGLSHGAWRRPEEFSVAFCIMIMLWLFS